MSESFKKKIIFGLKVLHFFFTLKKRFSNPNRIKPMNNDFASFATNIFFSSHKNKNCSEMQIFSIAK